MGLLDYPLDWSDRRLRELRDVLTSGIYRSTEIEALVAMVGMSPGDLDFGQTGRSLWYSAMNLAAGHKCLGGLVDGAVERVPALADRVEQLLRAEPVLDPAQPHPPKAWKNFGQERQIVDDQPTLVDVVFLQRGVERAKAVCKLSGRNRRRQRFYATGFRIGERTILTNHHVLHDWDDGGGAALNIEAEFGYEVDLFGRIREDTLVVPCDVTSIRGERDHDFAVVDTCAPLPADIPILSLGSEATVTVDDRVYIVQHPMGLPKKIGMLHNLVRYADASIVQYWTDTEPGSSGSPVFNDDWQVVALHHMAVDAPANDGVAFRNQGRTIGRVAERLTALGVNLGVGQT